jgi:molybdopterin-guanine dinucleotide biosynthesis protein
MVLIGSTGKNVGKTVAACSIIKALKQKMPVIALKVTTADRHGTSCHRGGDGCGACIFGQDFVLEEETDPTAAKDTARLLAAGAERVFWLRAKSDHLASGFKAFLAKIPNQSFIVVESNSLREVVKPGVFIMMVNTNERYKPSALKVLPYADLTIENEGTISLADAEDLVKSLVVKDGAQICLENGQY